MVIEVALIILIVIMLVTELMKYAAQNYTLGHKYGMCQCNREAFSENCLFARTMEPRVTLRYW